jgi:hypothetical protein
MEEPKFGSCHPACLLPSFTARRLLRHSSHGALARKTPGHSELEGAHFGSDGRIVSRGNRLDIGDILFRDSMFSKTIDDVAYIFKARPEV